MFSNAEFADEQCMGNEPSSSKWSRRRRLHVFVYGLVSLLMLGAGVTFSLFAITRTDSFLGKMWLAGPTSIVVGLVLLGKVIIDCGAAIPWSTAGSELDDGPFDGRFNAAALSLLLSPMNLSPPPAAQNVEADKEDSADQRYAEINRPQVGFKVRDVMKVSARAAIERQEEDVRRPSVDSLGRLSLLTRSTVSDIWQPRYVNVPVVLPGTASADLLCVGNRLKANNDSTSSSPQSPSF